MLRAPVSVLMLAWVLATMAPLLAHASATGQQRSSKPAAEVRKSSAAANKPKAQSSQRPVKKKVVKRKPPPRPPSFGMLAGLRATEDPLSLHSSVALVVDQETDQVLFAKNSEAVLPIASITKLMTALVITEADLPMDQVLTVTQDDVRATARANMRSRLVPGTRMTRERLLHLALMSSENRAANVLGRTYPGGMPAFVRAMNVKARALGMGDTRYVEPTGLSADNQSSAQDLAQLVRAAFQHPVLRELSTMPAAALPVGQRQVQYRNTNGLVHNPEWDIGLQKTGYIAAAGRCVVMQTELAGRKLIMVLLDSAGRYSRIGDAERIRRWLAENATLDALLPGARPAPTSLQASKLLPLLQLEAGESDDDATGSDEDPTSRAEGGEADPLEQWISDFMTAREAAALPAAVAAAATTVAADADEPVLTLAVTPVALSLTASPLTAAAVRSYAE